MIQANEKLLPGNVVMWHDRPYTLDAKDIWHISIDIKSFRNTLSPIPITPEVLVGWCGFEKDGFGAYSLSIPRFPDQYRMLVFSGDYLYLREGNDDKRANDSVCVIWNNDLQGIMPLHTLQNIKYFLTGEELVVTIPKQ